MFLKTIPFYELGYLVTDMPKTKDEQITADEKAVLSELRRYAKDNIEQIANHCGFSRQKVWRIIKKLEEKKIIWGYSTIFDEQKLDVQKFILLIKRKASSIDENTLEQVVFGYLNKSYDELGIAIESSYYLHGEFDWVLIFTAKDLKQAKKFITVLSGYYASLIEKVSLVQALFPQRRQYILNPFPVKLKELV